MVVDTLKSECSITLKLRVKKGDQELPTVHRNLKMLSLASFLFDPGL